MTKTEDKSASAAVKDILLSNPDELGEVIRTVLQEVLEAEMDEALGASKSERTPERLGYRSGHYGRTLVTRVGKLELRVPQDRAGRFSTELFERYQRSERALVATLAEMYVQGVSTRKVKAITEELCGHAFSASSISAINKRLDESLKAFAERPLQEPFAYLILDARYEKVREAGIVTSQAVLIAVGIDWDGRRQILAVEMANRESRSAWKDFLVALKARGLKGVELVVSDDHAGLVAAIGEVIPEAAWQRCYVHFLRNALDHLPRQHHKHLKSTNMLERLNEEIRRRTYVVRIFPNAKSCLRLVRALAVETHEAIDAQIRSTLSPRRVTLMLPLHFSKQGPTKIASNHRWHRREGRSSLLPETSAHRFRHPARCRC